MLPQRISILGLDFDVRLVDEVDHSVPADGQIDFIAQEIRIYRGLSEQKAEQVLIHEVLHGVLTQLGFDDESDNEHLVQSLAVALHQVCSQVISSCP